MSNKPLENIRIMLPRCNIKGYNERRYNSWYQSRDSGIWLVRSAAVSDPEPRMNYGSKNELGEIEFSPRTN